MADAPTTGLNIAQASQILERAVERRDSVSADQAPVGPAMAATEPRAPLPQINWLRVIAGMQKP